MGNAQQPRGKPKGFFRRRNYLINKPFQLRFIGQMMAVAVVVVGVFYLSNEYFFWNLRSEAKAQNVPLDHIFFRYLEYHEQRLTLIFWITAGIVGIGIGIFGLLYSHRIAGPLYRLTKHFEAIARGERAPSKVSFREGDYFQEIAAAYNSQLNAGTKDEAKEKKAG